MDRQVRALVPDGRLNVEVVLNMLYMLNHQNFFG